MRKKFRIFYVLSALTLLFSACKKTDNFESDALEEYFNLVPGKYVIYQLDSTKYINLDIIKTSYQAKDEVDAAVTDNLGRPAWRILRSIRDSAGTQAWVPSLTYYVIPERETIELIENNFRYQKLKLPITDGFNWHGNTFLPNRPYLSTYGFNNDFNIADWDYTYENLEETVTINDREYENTITVAQIRDSIDVPLYASKSYWIEKYSKGIGLVFKEVEIWEYQPPTQGNPAYRLGFGIKLSILDHN